MIRIKLNILIGMLCFLLASCFIDNDNGRGGNSYGQVDVTFSVTLPLPETVDTRAGLPYTDADIKNVDVLVFDKDGKFMERIKVDGAALSATSSGVNFFVRLDATPDKRIIHLVANGRTADGVTDRVNFQDIAVGTSESVAIPSLSTSVISVGNGLLADIMPLVMWGRTELNGISVVSKAEAVKLLRVAASIQVRAANATPENGLNDFQIKRIALMKSLKKGYLTPAGYSGEASIPNESRPMEEDGSWNIDKSWSVDNNPVLYTYECAFTASDYQGVIISAVYKGQPCYYKVAVVDGQTPVDIIRNHRYILTVSKVNGVGYADVNTAVGSAPSNAIKVSLTDENEDFPCIVADGQHLMGLTNNSVVVYGKLTSAELGTVYSSRGIEPVLTVPAGCDWLVGLRTRALGDNKYAIVGDFYYGAGRPSCSTALTLTCDNLSQTMQVDWNPAVSDNKDADSYVVTLFGSRDKNWTARVVTSESDPKGVFLSSKTSDPTKFNPATGEGIDEYMTAALNSIYASNAYLHIAADERGKGTVKVNTSVNGVAVSRRIVIWVR